MDSRRLHKQRIEEILKVAKEIVAGEIDPVIGARLVHSLSVVANVANEDVFKFFRTISMESNYLTLAEMMNSRNHSSIEMVNLELESYAHSIREASNETCRVLIEIIEGIKAA